MQEESGRTVMPPTEEEAGEITLDVTGTNGHTELSFSKGQVRVTWKETNATERGLIKGLIQTGRLFGFVPYSVDDDGKPKEMLTKLPGTFRGKKGEIVLVGEVQKVKLFAQEMIEGEIRENRLVLEAQADGTWKALKPGDFKAEPGKKKKVTSSEPVGGG